MLVQCKGKQLEPDCAQPADYGGKRKRWKWRKMEWHASQTKRLAMEINATNVCKICIVDSTACINYCAARFGANFPAPHLWFQSLQLVLQVCFLTRSLRSHVSIERTQIQWLQIQLMATKHFIHPIIRNNGKHINRLNVLRTLSAALYYVTPIYKYFNEGLFTYGRKDIQSIWPSISLNRLELRSCLCWPKCFNYILGACRICCLTFISDFN